MIVQDLSQINNPWTDYDPTQSEECRECSILPFCMGGCPDRYFKVIKETGRGDCASLKGYLSEITHYIDRVRQFGLDEASG